MMDVACSASESKNDVLFSYLINTIGSAYYELNLLKKSRTNFELALGIRQRSLPEDDPQTAIVLANLGNVETAEGSFEEAHDLLERAARIRERSKEALLLGLTFLQLGRNWFLQNEFDKATQMYNKADTCFAKKGAEDPFYLAHLSFARGNVQLEKALLRRHGSSSGGYEQALWYYAQCKDICDATAPCHPLTAANLYKMACTEWALEHSSRALLYLEKAYNIALIRSPVEIDGTIARIWWKKAEILIDDPIRRDEGVKLKELVQDQHGNIVDALQLVFEADELFTDKAFDMLVPGYFR